MTKSLELKPKEDGSGQITPGQLLEYLHSLQPRLDTDPHFRYGISLDPVMPPPPDDPGLLVAMSTGTSGPSGSVVTVKVFPRFAAALEFRSIPLNVTFRAEPGSQFAEDLLAFHKYGAPLEAPTGTVEFNGDLPGGLGGSFVGGSARLGPAVDAGPGYELRMAAVAPDQSVQAEALLDMAPVSVGVQQTGVRGHGTDRARVFDVEFLADLETERLKFSLTMRDLTGRRPAELLDAIKFLLVLRPPNALAFAAPYGPVSAPTVALGDHPDWLDADMLKQTLVLLETLTAIQAHTTVQLMVPPPESISADAINDWITARRLLEGEVIKLSSLELTVHVHPDADPPEGQFAVATQSELTVSIGEQIVSLGQQVLHCPIAEAVPGSAHAHDDHQDVVIRAVANSPITIRLQPPTTEA